MTRESEFVCQDNAGGFSSHRRTQSLDIPDKLALLVWLLEGEVGQERQAPCDADPTSKEEDHIRVRHLHETWTG